MNTASKDAKNCMDDSHMKEAVNYIYGIPKFNKKSSLDNTRELLKRLDAECSDIPVIHVAGTNGKGSVCAYMESVLRSAGYRTGLFTSPHLVRVNERIAIDGVPVGDGKFLETFEKVKKISQEMSNDGFLHPSFFEFFFGMGMKIFSECRPDYIILETGLGGRLDSTNVFEKPRLTVITSIGLDHTDILGDTYEKIAYEKAGIIKKGVPVVFEDKRPDVTEVITERAEELGSETVILKPEDIRNVSYRDKKIDFCLDNKYYRNVKFSLNTMAAYQTENASTALMALSVLRIRDIDTIRKGLGEMKWLGRMEEIQPGVIVDGAHNDDGITRFIESVRNSTDVFRVLLFSAVKDKHYEGMIKLICDSGLFDSIVIGRLDDPRGLDTDTMEKCFEKNGVRPSGIFSNTVDALNCALNMKGSGTVYVAGSLYLAGEVIAAVRGGLK